MLLTQLYPARRALLALLFLMISLSTTFATDDETQLDELIFSKEGVKINITLFAKRNIDPAWASLSESFPRLLISELAICEEHSFSEEELLSIRKNLIKDKTISLYKNLEEKHTQRDMLLFDDERTPKKYNDFTTEIKEIKKQITAFEEIDPVAIPLPATYPIIMGNDPIENNESARSVGDLLITGSIEQFEDYFFLSVKLWNQLTKKETIIYRSTGTPGEFPDLAKAAAVQLRETILGRNWAVLNVIDVPNNGRVSVDGKFRGIGATRIEILTPGEHLVEVTAKGMVPLRQSITLKAYKESTLNISMEYGKVDSIIITSNPSGADIYLGSSWIGVTPLRVAKPEVAIQVTLTYPGYSPEKFKLEPKSAGRIDITLVEGIINKEEILVRKKDKFYNSMMWFSLSLALPAISSGIAQNLFSQTSLTANQYVISGSYDDYEKAKELENGYYASMAVFWSSVALCGGLAVNMFYRLYEYIKAGESVAE